MIWENHIQSENIMKITKETERPMNIHEILKVYRSVFSKLKSIWENYKESKENDNSLNLHDNVKSKVQLANNRYELLKTDTQSIHEFKTEDPELLEIISKVNDLKSSLQWFR